MTLYSIILFVHAIAVLVLTATLTMETFLLVQLRRTVRPSDARIWIGAVPAIAIAAASSLVTIYITGGYLTKSLHASEFAWSRFAIIDVLIFALFGIFSGLRVRRIRLYSTENTADQSEWNGLARSALLKLSLTTRICIVMGTVLLTAAKPGLAECLVIVAGALMLGALFSLVSFGRRSMVSTAQASSR